MPKPLKYNPQLTREQLINEYYIKGRSLEDIGLDFWTHESTVSEWMKIYGLETRKGGRKDLDIEKLKDYLADGKSVTYIARAFGVSTTKIYDTIKEYKLR